MNKQQAQKRKKLITAILLAGGGLLGIYFLLIHSLRSHVSDINRKLADVALEINSAQQTCKREPEMKSAMIGASNNLYQAEQKMAAGDVYFWMVKTLEEFQRNEDVEFNAIDPPKIEPSTALPKVKYSAARFNVTGRATYHDFGLFLAKFENTFPYMHLGSLELDASTLGLTGSTNSEELRFKMEVSILVGSNPTAR